MPVLTDEHGVELPARTAWERMRPINGQPFESFLLSWIRAGKIQLRFAPHVVELTYHLPWLGSNMQDVRQLSEANQGAHWRMLKQALMQPPYSFKYNGTFKVWTAVRQSGPAHDQVWEPLVGASQAWIHAPGGAVHEAARLAEIRRQREAREAEQAAADAARAERARAAEARAAEARAAASDRQRLERQGRVQEARAQLPPPPPANEESEDDDGDAPRPGDYVRTFGVNPDRAFGDAIANQALDRREKELNENMIREEKDSGAQRVPLRYNAMRLVRDLVNKTLDAMYDRIQGEYHDEELHPVDDATWVQFEVKTKLEIIEGVKVTLRASTSPSRAKAAQVAGHNDEPDAAIGWSLLFARNSVERARVNAGLIGAGYAAVAGGGQVQVRNDNTLNIALNKVWESLDSIRQDAVRAAPARQPPASDQLVVVRHERSLAERGNNQNDDESDDDDDEATETSEEGESESESEDGGAQRRRRSAIDGEDTEEEEEASASEDSESEAESSDEGAAYSDYSEDEESAESSESESSE